jgi:hypothetical protein
MRESEDQRSVSGAHCVFFLVFDHLARAAFWAISRRCSGESAAALASPPFLAPNLDNATACGFFFFSPMTLKSICLIQPGKTITSLILDMPTRASICLPV